jgi:ferric-dicitrate binding protein FerR (iron transport regulator)
MEMEDAKKAETKRARGQGTETLEITRRAIKANGIRTAALVVAAAAALGFAYILVSFGRPTVTTSASGDNGTAIGQARDVTVNNGVKEDK